MDQDGEKMDVCKCINILLTLSRFLFVLSLLLSAAMSIMISESKPLTTMDILTQTKDEPRPP